MEAIAMYPRRFPIIAVAVLALVALAAVPSANAVPADSHVGDPRDNSFERCERPYWPGVGPLPYGPITPWSGCVGLNVEGCQVFLRFGAVLCTQEPQL